MFIGLCFWYDSLAGRHRGRRMAKDRITLGSLLADGIRPDPHDMWLCKAAQEQPDETQFAQDFSNLAFQFMQDRSPALMKYLLGFEVVDRSENGTRAVGVFGFKIDGQYYYVPAFFMNSQVKGIDSILSKSTNSFVPLTEEWVNYIINRKANELGGEAEVGDGRNGTSGMGDFENPNFNFLRSAPVPTSGGASYKAASAEDNSPWSLRHAWQEMKSRIDEMLEKDAAFREDVVGTLCRVRGVRHPFEKDAESADVLKYLGEVGGPRAERTLLKAMRNAKMAEAAMEFYSGPLAFHPAKYVIGKCHALKKEAQEAEDRKPKVEIVADANSEAEARDVIEDGFTVRDRRPDSAMSDVIDTDYERSFQNPDRPGVYNVLVDGGETRRAYVLAADRLFHKGVSGTMHVYFPDNRQLVQARNDEILCDGGCIGRYDEVYGDASDIPDCRQGDEYIFVGPEGTSLPSFHINNVKRNKGERPVLGGSFAYCGEDDWEPDPKDDFTNYFAGDPWHTRGGLMKPFDTFSICSVELADFDGRPKLSHGTVVLPKDWKALRVGQSYDELYKTDDDGHLIENDRVKYNLGTLNQLTIALRKEGAAKLDMRFDSDGFYYSFDGQPFTQPMSYKKAAIDLVTKFNVRWPEARSILKRAEADRSARCLVKMAQIDPSQLVNVETALPPGPSPSSDPYTGIPVYQSPYYDATEMPMGGVDQSVSEDNVYGENLGGEISRQSQMGGDPTGDAEFDQEAMGIAENAAQLGQKHVFDKAAIGGLAKVYDTGAVIDSYLPEFMTAVDRLGRTLFLFYWKHNDFIDRYGTDDVIEMEDVLRSTFKQLGKLTMDLRRKSVGGGDADSGSSDLLR